MTKLIIIMTLLAGRADGGAATSIEATDMKSYESCLELAIKVQTTYLDKGYREKSALGQSRMSVMAFCQTNNILMGEK